jgi:Protein of unknown function (DUF1570)
MPRNTRLLRLSLPRWENDFAPPNRRALFAVGFCAMFAMSTLVPRILLGGEPISEPLRLMELHLDSNVERGLPIAWNANRVQLLRVDGSIGEFEPKAIRRHQVLDEAFKPDSAMRMRGDLQREFGKRYAVEGGGNFAIVAPTATVHLWAERFSQLDRSFQNYFATRGYILRPAEFPLVGIVFPSQKEFLTYASRTGTPLQPGTVGYYSILTNRLFLYEASGNERAEQEALMTVWHEAAHQIAFNRGVHQRLSDPPFWMAEGLASIFEAPGMMSQRSTMNSSDLINESRWENWKRLAESSDKMASMFDRMVRDNRLFRSQPPEAYAIAWGVSLYLAERHSNQYMQYLRKLSKLPPGVEYSETARIRDFQEAFNTNSIMLIKSADRFLQNL